MNYNNLPITLRQLQYVLAVADTLSFRKAAALCHVAQPSLSAQIAQLEDALGVRLFERDRRRVLSTKAGEALVARARQVLVEAEALVESAKRLSDPLAGTLRLGVIPTISPYLLPELSPRLRAAFRDLTILWHEDKTEVLVDKVSRGELDAAILAEEADLADLVVTPIGKDAFVLAAPKGHPLGRKATPARPSDLEGANVLLLDDGHCFREQVLDVCSREGALELAFRGTSLATLVQMVVQGVGVTLLPKMAASAETARTDLRLRPFVKPPPFRTIALASRRGSAVASAIGAIAEVGREAMAVCEKE